MGREKRYCIRCGHEIGERPYCVNPDCAELPNFYKDVAAPAPRVHAEGSTLASRRTSPSPAAERDSPITEPVARLREIMAPYRSFALHPGSVYVGARRSAQVLLDHPQISSRHAQIDCVQSPDGSWMVVVSDRASKNGTFVNGERIDRAALASGDTVCFADIEFVLEFQERRNDRQTIEL